MAVSLSQSLAQNLGIQWDPAYSKNSMFTHIKIKVIKPYFVDFYLVIFHIKVLPLCVLYVLSVSEECGCVDSWVGCIMEDTG